MITEEELIQAIKILAECLQAGEGVSLSYYVRSYATLEEKELFNKVLKELKL